MKQFWFGYARWYYLTHPWKWVEDLLLNLKWAYQRVYRGWDDRVIWSIDYYLSYMLPIWLQKLKGDKRGIPVEFFNENMDNEEEAEALWNSELDKMICGFKVSFDMLDGIYNVKEREKLMVVYEKGMESFSKHFFSLWD